MRAGDRQPTAQFVALRVVFDRLFIVGQRIAPAALPLQQLPLPDDVVDAVLVDHRFLRDENLGVGGCPCPSGTDQKGQECPRNAPASIVLRIVRSIVTWREGANAAVTSSCRVPRARHIPRALRDSHPS